MGTQLPSPKKGAEPPIFGPSLLWPNGWMHQDATWYGGRPQRRRLFVKWGPSPYPKRGEPHPIFGPRLLSPNGCMHQDATWYGGMASAYATAFDVHPATPEKRAHPPHPILGPCLLWPNGWMGEDAAWYGSRPRHRLHCTRRGPSCRERGTGAPLLFGPCLLWPRSPISAIAELVLFGSVRQIKLAVRQLLDARKYSVSYCVVSYVSF